MCNTYTQFKTKVDGLYIVIISVSVVLGKKAIELYIKQAQSYISVMKNIIKHDEINISDQTKSIINSEIKKNERISCYISHLMGSLSDDDHEKFKQILMHIDSIEVLSETKP